MLAMDVVAQFSTCNLLSMVTAERARTDDSAVGYLQSWMRTASRLYSPPLPKYPIVFA